MLGWLKDRFRRGPVVPVVRLSGVIASGGLLGSRGLSIESVAPLLKRAFDMRGAKAVALAINSPGGSPVQSALIGQRIRLLAAEKNLPVIAFVEDVAASGGYWLACAADEIIVDPSSIVGSIGVISAGFGFQDLIARIGVERRVHTSGERKAMLDPFRPEKPEDVERLHRLQAEIHDGFKDWVRERRAGKLKGDEAAAVQRRVLDRQARPGAGPGRRAGRVARRAAGALRRQGASAGDRTARAACCRASASASAGGSGIDGIGPATLAAIEERLHWQRFGL